MPDTWPRIQFSGSGLGQNGSGWKRGTSCAAAAVDTRTKPTNVESNRMVASLLHGRPGAPRFTRAHQTPGCRRPYQNFRLRSVRAPVGFGCPLHHVEAQIHADLQMSLHAAGDEVLAGLVGREGELAI